MNQLAVAALERVVELARRGRRKALVPALEKALMLWKMSPRRLPRWVQPGIMVKETVPPYRRYQVVHREYVRSLGGYKVVVELPTVPGGHVRHVVFFDSYKKGIFPWRRHGRAPLFPPRRAR